MKNEYYYVYCSGILSVKTNIKNFKWIYGVKPKFTTFEEYSKCSLKFNITVKRETELDGIEAADERFQLFSLNSEEKKVFYRRRIFKFLNIGYSIKFLEDVVDVVIGKNYLKFVKGRIMNLHGMYYLLSDIANALLLKKGYLTLYSSSVYNEKIKKGIICFAAPNTGKTITAMNLCKDYGFYLVGEDVVITDGENIYSCPETNSYRGKNNLLDSGGGVRKKRVKNKLDYVSVCRATDIFVLTKAEKSSISNDYYDIQRKIKILNGYLFRYYSSPIIKVLEYFFGSLDLCLNKNCEKIMEKLFDRCNCYEIKEPRGINFCNIIIDEVLGDKNEGSSDNKECMG